MSFSRSHEMGMRAGIIQMGIIRETVALPPLKQSSPWSQAEGKEAALLNLPAQLFHVDEVWWTTGKRVAYYVRHLPFYASCLFLKKSKVFFLSPSMDPSGMWMEEKIKRTEKGCCEERHDERKRDSKHEKGFIEGLEELRETKVENRKWVGKLKEGAGYDGERSCGWD